MFILMIYNISIKEEVDNMELIDSLIANQTSKNKELIDVLDTQNIDVAYQLIKQKMVELNIQI